MLIDKIARSRKSSTYKNVICMKNAYIYKEYIFKLRATVQCVFYSTSISTLFSRLIFCSFVNLYINFSSNGDQPPIIVHQQV